jgi:hypothetical protein
MMEGGVAVGVGGQDCEVPLYFTWSISSARINLVEKS